MRRPSRRLLLGASYLPAIFTLIDFAWRRRAGAHAMHGV